MSAYGNVTAKPYGYVLIDNHPKTTSEKQVVSDVIDQCQSYPHMSTQLADKVSRDTTEMIEPPKQSETEKPVTRNIELSLQNQQTVRKRSKQQSKQAKKRSKQQSKQTKKQLKQTKKQTQQLKAASWMPFTDDKADRVRYKEREFYEE